VPGPRQAWATIDECRPVGAVATVGVLAWMPVDSAKSSRMVARIRLQYRDASGRWRPIENGDTGNLRVGNGKRAALRGYTFALGTEGSALIRARVSFTWSAGRRTLVRRIVDTSARRPTGRYGTPLRFSAATCRL